MRCHSSINIALTKGNFIKYPSNNPRMKFTSVSRHQIYLIWCVALFFLVLLLIEPISYSFMRWAIAILVATIWLGSLYLWWERITFRIGILAIGAFFGLFLILPGRPILAYIGKNKWIEADPGYHKTIVVTVPEPNNFWFQTPVYILRWRQLAR
jgi:hypothetical protein